jgi:hypothetical protein
LHTTGAGADMDMMYFSMCRAYLPSWFIRNSFLWLLSNCSYCGMSELSAPHLSDSRMIALLSGVHWRGQFWQEEWRQISVWEPSRKTDRIWYFIWDGDGSSGVSWVVRGNIAHWTEKLLRGKVLMWTSPSMVLLWITLRQYLSHSSCPINIYWIHVQILLGVFTGRLLICHRHRA